MRKIATFFSICAIAIAATFSSCSKNKDKTAQEQLVGKWTMDAAIGNYGYDGQVEKDTTYFTAADYIQFNQDGTLHIEDTGDKYDGKWTISGNKVVITGTGYMDFPGGFTLKQLTSSLLELYYSQAQGSTTVEQTFKLKK